MSSKQSRPFLKLSPKGWTNLATAATLTFYVILFTIILINMRMCENIGFDYCAYWSVGKIINTKGYAAVYDLDILKQVQQDIIPLNTPDTDTFQPIEAPYLPIFLIPFQLFSLFNLTPSFFLWALINYFALACYLIFFMKDLRQDTQPVNFRIALLLLISLPVVINFFEGQLNVWLTICIGEFIRAIHKEKDIKAGLWIGGWLLKPQLLILILPILLIQRKFKVLVGFILSSVTMLFLTTAMISFQGILDLLRIWFESGQGRATSNAAAMMNWRMLGFHLSRLINPTLGTIIAIMGTLATLLITIFIFQKRVPSASKQFQVALLGIIAATCLTTWHAHLHTAMILIPMILLLSMCREFNINILRIWVFVPVLVRLISYAILNAVSLSLPFEDLALLVYLLGGLTGLGVNLLIFVWSIKVFNDRQEIHAS